jgi:hypothetical protein
MKANTTPALPAGETIWAFDLGKGSIGEAVRQGNSFPHRESLLIPPDLARRGPAAVSGTPANKFRAMKTREAHHERERWLAKVWKAAGLDPLQAREVHQNPQTGKWELKHKADYRLEREFAPTQFRKNRSGHTVGASYPDGKAQDGAPARTGEDFAVCYTSSLLRIRLLRGDDTLAEWQIYKALRSALQKRGYGPVPWAAKEALKQGKTAKELRDEEEKELQQADERYRLAAGKWPKFKDSVAEAFQFPCYYDAQQMGLWNPAEPDKLLPRSNHLAVSTRNIRFDRVDVRAEMVKLGDEAAAILPKLRDAFGRWKREGWKFRHPVTGKELSYPVSAKTFGEFLCDGPAGKPDESSFEAFLKQRKKAGVQRGSFEEWMAALGQKTPSFDNRILNDCVLIPRFHVCKVDVRLASDGQGKPTGEVIPESLLATEVTLLLKLKNLLVSDPVCGQRKLTAEEVRNILNHAHRRLNSLALIEPNGELTKQWPKKVADRFAVTKSEWKNIALESEFLRRLARLPVADSGKNRPLTGGETSSLLKAVGSSKKDADLGLPEHLRPLFKAAKAEWKKAKAAADDHVLRPMPGHEEVKAPKTSGRSAYSRVALRILKELILSGEAPSDFHARLCDRDAELLRRLGSSPDKPLTLFDDSTAPDDKKRQKENDANRKRGLLVADLRFLLQMRKENEPDDWKNIFVPSQTLDALQQRHTEDGKLDADAAIRDLLGTINDPIVRHRLEVFSSRLKKLRHGDAKEQIPAFGMPDAVVLEFVREDFMGEKALGELKSFQKQREEERAEAKKMAADAGAQSGLSALKYQLWKAQGGECLYGKEILDKAGDSKGKCIYRETSLPLSNLDEYVIDHIVPRGEPYNGPDAMVNYVLTTHETNEAKGKRTPFEWLHNAPDWNAYVNRVNARATMLRNKKVQLLTRQDAPELVQRYTALAETAWVSKLAQTIVNLRFGWTNGYDEKREKRVIVVSGGLTARVRRKYGLDKLLYSDVTDPDVLAKKVKNREDKRHHALDAMVLTFIPQWARDPDKEGFLRFPSEFRDATGREDYQRIRDLFQTNISEVVPRHLIYERPELRETNYGAREDEAGKVMVQRVEVASLAQKPVPPQKTKFDLDYLAGQIKAVRDAAVRMQLLAEHAKSPDEAHWNKFCADLRQQRKDGSTGARIIYVTQTLDKEPVEFKDLSKDGSGAYRTTKQKHRGQFVYLDLQGKPVVEPVRVFDSVSGTEKALRARAGFQELVGFFESYCLVELQQKVVHGIVELVAGIYKLNTLKQDGRAQVTNASGVKSPEVSLKKLLTAGFRRID